MVSRVGSAEPDRAARLGHEDPLAPPLKKSGQIVGCGKNIHKAHEFAPISHEPIDQQDQTAKGRNMPSVLAIVCLPPSNA